MIESGVAVASGLNSRTASGALVSVGWILGVEVAAAAFVGGLTWVAPGCIEAVTTGSVAIGAVSPPDGVVGNGKLHPESVIAAISSKKIVRLNMQVSWFGL
jgi:hypothetical protein